VIKVSTTKGMARYVNILIYAVAGWGKTEQCKNAPEPLLLSAEGGLLTLTEVDIPLLENMTIERFKEVSDWLDISREAKKYTTICVDSLSEVAEVLLSQEMKKTKDARQAYGVMHNEMSILIRRLIFMKKDVYFTAKLKVLKTDAGVITYVPNAPGQQLLQALPYFFDEVLVGRYGKLKDGTQYRYIQTNEDRQYHAKDRSGTLRKIMPPDLGVVINTIKAGVRLKEQEK